MRTASPHDNLCAALGILQGQILADDTSLDPEKMFGVFNMHRLALEHAAAR